MLIGSTFAWFTDSVTSAGNKIQSGTLKVDLELLDKEIPRLRHKIKSVHLCFSTDPFMYEYDEVSQMSMAAIRKLNSAGIKCTVLTKGILPVELSSLSKENEYGITVVSLNEDFVKQYEPGAAPITDRIAALRSLSNKGCKTWVSIEPFPTPNIIQQDLNNLLNELSFVDRIIFGQLHYSKSVSAYPDHVAFYNNCANTVIDFCTSHGISYHIKKGTQKDPK
jgi:predicted ribosomally synthesized peptide with SipW-like signal peptide